MQKVDVLVYSINSTWTNYELLQYSKYDTVEDLFNRISDYWQNESFALWNTKKSNKSAYSFISSLKTQFKNSKFANIDGEEIQNTEDNIMTLGLDDKRLLIIEKYWEKSWFKSTNTVKNNQKTKLNKINKRKKKIKENISEEEEKKEQKKPSISSKAGSVSAKNPSLQILNNTNKKYRIKKTFTIQHKKNENKIQNLFPFITIRIETLPIKALPNLRKQVFLIFYLFI